MDSKTVGPNLVFFRIARTMGYNLFVTNELIETEVLDVASSNRLERSIVIVFV